MDFKNILARIEAEHADAVAAQPEDADYIVVNAENWAEVAQFLASDPQLHFDSLMSITGYEKTPGGELISAYNLYSMDQRHELEIRIAVPVDKPNIPSVANLWRTADWHERETYDLMGIIYDGHPDFRRILLPYDWVGHPLRKDFVTPDYYKGMPIPKDKRGWE